MFLFVILGSRLFFIRTMSRAEAQRRAWFRSGRVVVTRVQDVSA